MMLPYVGHIKLVHIMTVPESLRFITGQPAYMRERGFAIHSISSDGPDREDFVQREGIDSVVVEMPRRISPLRDLAAVIRIWLHIRRLKPAIVHAHTPKGGLLGMIGSWLARVPVRVYHIHGLPMVTATGSQRVALRLAERVSCYLATDVLCVSRSVREVVLREGLNGRRAVEVLCGGSINGVDTDERFNPARYDAERVRIRTEYGIPDGAPVLGFVGRLVRDKGVIELMQAWAVLRAEFPESHLLVVGPFEARDAIPEAVKEEMQRDDRIHLRGMDWDTPPLFATMDVLALPSYREGFPVVPLEAAAMALPVIATAVPGCVDAVVDGVTGTLIPPADAVALATAVRNYLRSPQLRSEHGAAGRQRVVIDFRREEIWAATFNVYARALRRVGMVFDGNGEIADAVAHRGEKCLNVTTRE